MCLVLVHVYEVYFGHAIALSSASSEVVRNSSHWITYVTKLGGPQIRPYANGRVTARGELL